MCSSTCLRLSLVVEFFHFSGTNFDDDFFSFPFSRFRKGRNFYRETVIIDDFSDGNFSGANAPLLMYICVSSHDFPFRVFGFVVGFVF